MVSYNEFPVKNSIMQTASSCVIVSCHTLPAPIMSVPFLLVHSCANTDVSQK